MARSCENGICYYIGFSIMKKTSTACPTSSQQQLPRLVPADPAPLWANMFGAHSRFNWSNQVFVFSFYFQIFLLWFSIKLWSKAEYRIYEQKRITQHNSVNYDSSELQGRESGLPSFTHSLAGPLLLPGSKPPAIAPGHCQKVPRRHFGFKPC